MTFNIDEHPCCCFGVPGVECFDGDWALRQVSCSGIVREDF